jgi:hypothetical protein
MHVHAYWPGCVTYTSCQAICKETWHVNEITTIKKFLGILKNITVLDAEHSRCCGSLIAHEACIRQKFRVCFPLEFNLVCFIQQHQSADLQLLSSPFTF